MTAVEVGAQIRTTLRKFMDAMAQAACMVDSAVNRDELWVQSRSGASDSIRKGKRRSLALRDSNERLEPYIPEHAGAHGGRADQPRRAGL